MASVNDNDNVANKRNVNNSAAIDANTASRILYVYLFDFDHDASCSVLENFLAGQYRAPQ